LLLIGLVPPVMAQGIPGSATVVNSCGTPPSTYTAGQNQPVLQDTSGRQCNTSNGTVNSASQYPAGAIPITASATGTTAATTATLAAGTTTTTYLCGFAIRANATAAATGNATVTGTKTGTLNFTQWTAPLASGIGLVEETFGPCVPASAVNTGIAVISAAPGSGGVVSVSAWGYQL
jgi:hypothetical protein